MTLTQMKELQAKVAAASQAAEDAAKARDTVKAERDACEDEAKQAELDAEIATAETMCKEAQDAVIALEAEVDEAVVGRDEQKRRESVLAKASGLFTQDTPAAAQPNPQSMTPEVKDWDAHGAAQMETIRKFLEHNCSKSEAQLDGEQRKLIEGDSYNITGSSPANTKVEKRQYADSVAVLPKWFSRTILGAMFQSKTIYSIDDAANNPSLAHNLVPQEFRNTLLQLPMPPATVLPWVTRVPTNTGELTFPRLVQTDTAEPSTVAMTWIEETDDKPVTEPLFAQQTVRVHELAGYTELSHKILIRSAIALEPLLASLYRTAIALELERTILNGTGTGQPLGVLQAAGVHQLARNAADTVGWEDCKELKHELQFYHRDGARFVIGDGAEEALENEQDTLGRPLFSATVSSGPYDRISGYPYNISYNSPTLGNNGDVIFGVWKYYYLVVEEDVMIAKSDHYRFQQNRRAIKVFMNVGGVPIQPRAFAFLVGVSGS